MVANKKARNNLLVYLHARGAIDRKHAVPIRDCPVKGLFLKNPGSIGRKLFKVVGNRIYLDSMGNLSALAELIRRVNVIHRSA